MRTLALIALAALAGLSSPAHAQKGKSKEPRRPKLDAAADTNDAMAYFNYAMQQETPWDKTADALYWARKLDPSEPFFAFAHYSAFFNKQSPQWRSEYWDGAEYVVNSKEAKQLDSLQYQYMMADPYAHYGSRECRIPDWFQDVEDPLLLGTLLFDYGCYTQAADTLGKAIAKHPRAIAPHYLRARAFYALQQWGNTTKEMQLIIDSLRAKEAKKVQHVYESKEMYEYMLGRAYARNEDYHAAREAYGRSLTENLTFYPAHIALAEAALAQEDFDTALQEYEQSVQIDSADAALRTDYGTTLMRVQPPKSAEAEAQFRKAVELAPLYAVPYYRLALALDAQGKKAEAVEWYGKYLERAPRRAANMIARSKERLTVLTAAGAPK